MHVKRGLLFVTFYTVGYCKYLDFYKSVGKKIWVNLKWICCLKGNGAFLWMKIITN